MRDSVLKMRDSYKKFKEYDEMFDVFVIETKLSQKIPLKGSYFMHIHKFKIVLRSKIDYSEVQSWPLSCILHYSSQVNNKEIIFLITCDAGCGVLRFTSSASEEMDSYLKYYTDKLRLKSSRPLSACFGIKNGKRASISLNHFFCFDCNATDRSKCNCWCSNCNCNKSSIKHTNKSCNKNLQDIFPKIYKSYIEPDISNIEPWRYRYTNKKHNIKHASCSSYDNEDDIIILKNGYLELTENTCPSGRTSNLFNSGFFNSFDYEESISDTSEKTLTYSSPELQKEMKMRRSSEPFRPMNKIYKLVRNFKSFDAAFDDNSSVKKNKVYEKSSNQNSLDKFSNKYIQNKKNYLNSLPHQVLNQDVRLLCKKYKRPSISAINFSPSIPERSPSSTVNYEYFCREITSNQENHIFEPTSFVDQQINVQLNVGAHQLTNIKKNDAMDEQVNLEPTDFADRSTSLQKNANYLSYSDVKIKYFESVNSHTNISTQILEERINTTDANVNKIMDETMKHSYRTDGLNKSTSLAKLFGETLLPFPQPKKNLFNFINMNNKNNIRSKYDNFKLLFK